jgi:hypothetical protein
MVIQRMSFFIILCLTAAACYYDTQEKLYGIASQNANCDTTGVTYSTNLVASKSVSAIINANCNSCHSQSQAQHNGGSIILDNYAALVVQANTNGNLMGDINHSAGHNAMPLNGGMLSACQIAVIQHWIDLGKPQN